MTSFEKIKINKVVKKKIKITENLVKKFTNLTQDHNPIHSDNKISNSTYFKGAIVHGMSYAIFFSKLIGNQLINGPSIWLSQNFNFKRKVLIGDSLTLECRIVSKNNNQKIIKVYCSGKNQANQIVIDGYGEIKYLSTHFQEVKKKSKKIRKALIIGGSSGIGEKIVRTLANDNFKVCFTYKNSHKAAIKIVKSNKNIYSYQSDFVKDDANTVTKNVEKILGGNIDILIICASERIFHGKILEIGYEKIQSNLDFSLRSSYNLCQTVVTKMKKNKFGRVINIGSTLTEKIAPNLSSYIISKQALKNFIQVLAIEYADENVTFNSISPYYTETKMLSDVLDETNAMVEKLKNPMNRLGKTTDVANCVKFLCTEENNYINGQNIILSGGVIN